MAKNKQKQQNNQLPCSPPSAAACCNMMITVLMPQLQLPRQASHMEDAIKDPYCTGLLTPSPVQSNGIAFFRDHWVHAIGFAKCHCPRNYVDIIKWKVTQLQLKEPLATLGGILGFHKTLVENGWSGEYILTLQFHIQYIYNNFIFRHPTCTCWINIPKHHPSEADRDRSLFT